MVPIHGGISMIPPYPFDLNKKLTPSDASHNESDFSESIEALNVNMCDKKSKYYTATSAAGRDQDNEIDFIEDLIKGGVFDDILNEDIFLADSKRRRYGRTKKLNYYTDTLWGRNLLHPDMKVATSKIARDFRRKFRVPFPVFDKIIVPECDRLDVFEVSDTARVRIPTDFKVMICLRILGTLK
jgi:hypothetical protein